MGESCEVILTQVLSKKPHQKPLMLLLLLSNVGLFIVDHIHFQVITIHPLTSCISLPVQYNGLLSGLLLLSIASLASHRVLVSGLLFSGLLMFKVRRCMIIRLQNNNNVSLQHIYLYIAPAFIVYMFRNYCFKTGDIIYTE